MSILKYGPGTLLTLSLPPFLSARRKVTQSLRHVIPGRARELVSRGRSIYREPAAHARTSSEGHPAKILYVMLGRPRYILETRPEMVSGLRQSKMFNPRTRSPAGNVRMGDAPSPRASPARVEGEVLLMYPCAGRLGRDDCAYCIHRPGWECEQTQSSASAGEALPRSQ